MTLKTIKHKRQTINAIRHSKNNEPPLPVKTGLMVHAKTRKKSLGEKLAVEGIKCIIFKSTRNRRQYYVTTLSAVPWRRDCVPKKHKKKGLFTVAVIENVDNDPSATTKCLFHGTSISM